MEKNNLEYVRMFNEVSRQFLEELVQTFPEQKSIKVGQMFLESLCKINIRKPVNDFIRQSLPYLEQIAMKDEEFLKNNNDKPVMLQKIKIEEWWDDDLSQSIKTTVWKYIKTLFAIAVKVVEIGPEYTPYIQFIINSD